DELAKLRGRADTNEKARAIEMDVVKERLDRLEKSLESLRATTRIASSFTPSATGPTGVIRLQNRPLVDATVLLVGQSYRVPPLETVVLPPQAPGSFSYEVLAEGFGVIRPLVARVLVAGETFSITINP